MSLVADYDESDESDEDEPAAPVPASLLVKPAALLGDPDEDEDDEDDEDDEAEKKRVAPPLPSAASTADEAGGSGIVLPDFEDALSQAETPAFLSAPPEEFITDAFDDRPPPPPKPEDDGSGI